MQRPPLQQPVRPTGNLIQRPPIQPGGTNNFKRVVSAIQQLGVTPEDSVTTNQTPVFQQRPPQPAVRPPSVFPQRNLPSGPISLPPENMQESELRSSQEGLNKLKTSELGSSISSNASFESEIDKISSPKNRSFSISVPNAPELTKPITEEDRRRSVAYGAPILGDTKTPLSFISEKFSSQSSIGEDKNVIKKEKDDDDDVVIPTKNDIPTPISQSKTPSPLPAQRSPLQNKSPSPNVSIKSSLNNSQEEVNNIRSQPEESSRPGSAALTRNSSRSSILGSLEDVTKLSRPSSRLGNESGKASPMPPPKPELNNSNRIINEDKVYVNKPATPDSSDPARLSKANSRQSLQSGSNDKGLNLEPKTPDSLTSATSKDLITSPETDLESPSGDYSNRMSSKGRSSTNDLRPKSSTPSRASSRAADSDDGRPSTRGSSRYRTSSARSNKGDFSSN